MLSLIRITVFNQKFALFDITENHGSRIKNIKVDFEKAYIYPKFKIIPFIINFKIITIRIKYIFYFIFYFILF